MRNPSPWNPESKPSWIPCKQHEDVSLCNNCSRWYPCFLMHLCISQFQLRPAPPPFPRATTGHLPALSVPGVGFLQILCCPGQFPNFWHARGFRSAYNYPGDFTGKESRLSRLSRTGKKLKRFVTARSWFYACISTLLIKPELHTAKSGAIDVNWNYKIAH